jgi:hypothetical protein
MRLELIAEGVEVAPLMDSIEAHPYLWSLETIRQDFLGSPHHDTQCIMFMGPEDLTFEAWQGTTIVEPNRSAIDPIAKDYYDTMADVDSMIDAFDIGYTMAVSLKAGGVVDEHIDEGIYAQYYDRYHLVLKSEEGNMFYNEDESVWMKEGELWKFDHRAMHYVENNSASDRWHLIIDATTGDKVCD